MTYARSCPSCGTELMYKNASSFNRASTKCSKCKSCAQAGKVFSEQTKKRMSMNAPDRKGTKNPMYGKSAVKGKTWDELRSKDTIQKSMSKLKDGLFKGHKHTDDSKLKISKRVSGTNNPFYGKTHTPETKELIRSNTLTMYENGKMPNSNTHIEQIMANILDELSIKYQRQKRLGFWSWDFYLIDYDIYIECDGDYWHANPNKYDSDDLNKTQRKNKIIHDRKTNYMVDRNIILLRFWESDIKDNRQMVLDQIKKSLNTA